jgi:(2Fe-2S) ferredoxin
VTPRRYKIIVCRGPECGERMGSSAIHAAFVQGIRLRRLEDRVELSWQSCFGRCRQAPNCLVRPWLAQESTFLVAIAPLRPGPGTAFYSGLTPQDAPRILDEHVIGGRTVHELVKRLEEPAKP